ncbi:MAG: ribokinase [Beijerinckiaceae bacterium]
MTASGLTQPSPSILVVGSINIDVCVTVSRIPRAGETVSGDDAVISLGGKGANQAIAAARLGADVALVGCIGDDSFGEAARHFLKAEPVDLAGLRAMPGKATGVALITVDQSGQNAITVSPGANAVTGLHDVDEAFARYPLVRLLLLQNEVPMATALHAARTMRARGGLVIVDPAPAGGFDPALLSVADVVTPNETEAETLTGIKVRDQASAIAAVHHLLALGARTAVVKLGAAGVVYAGAYGEGVVAAPVVQAVDTVAAGDCFNGALAVALGEGRAFKDALVFACRAAAVSVTRHGASASMPYRKELA